MKGRDDIIESQNVQSVTRDDLVIIIDSDKCGNGDSRWSTMLMESYLYALSESSKLPEKLIFYNSGVKLASEGSNVIESLEVLKSRGVKILICSACLDFYELKDKLILGEITNMYEIVDIMNSASNTIKV